MSQAAAQRIGVLFGLLADLALLASLWGIDGWSLARANSLLPWAKTTLAALCLLPALGLLGRLSMRWQSLAFSALAWALTGIAVGWWAGQVAFRLLPLVVVRAAPWLTGLLAYPYGAGPQTRTVLASIACMILFLAGGLTLRPLADTAAQSPYLASRISAIVLWLALFALAGGLVDALLQRPLRAPVAKLESLIAFRLADPLGLEREQARQLRANVLNPIEDLLPRPHRVAVSSYDDLLSQIQLVIDFQGSLVQCIFVEGSPVFCQTIEGGALQLPEGGQVPQG